VVVVKVKLGGEGLKPSLEDLILSDDDTLVRDRTDGDRIVHDIT
jgi:hypothetical protein